MIVKPDWEVFKSNFSDNPELNFEWMCYQLFCREFKKDKGIFRFYNQPTLETEPIKHNNDIIGFQAKFYKVNLSERKQKILSIIKEVKTRYPNLTILYFYSNQDWTALQTSSSDRKTEAQKEIEKVAELNNLKIEWRTKSFFESEFVTIENSDITQYFFDVNTNEYYKKIRTLEQRPVFLTNNLVYKTSLSIKNQEKPLFGQNVLCEYLIQQLTSIDLEDFPNIYVRGVAGIGKSTEMEIAYNKLLEKCSSENCYREFHFLPTPYFFELRNYQEGCLKINNNENALLFLDGIDEIQISKIIPFIKELSNLKSQNPSVRFIISGRDASFRTEINSLKHIDTRLSFYVDEELRQLIYKFKGTIFEPFIGIPFYRTFLCSKNINNIRTYKDFIATLITSRLSTDKGKFDRSENIVSPGKGIDLIKIENRLAAFSYELFKTKKNSFSISALNKYLNTNELHFLLKSCLIDYKNEDNISFFSTIYYEYFLAKYYSQQKFSLIRKELFLSTGKVVVHHINIIAILLNLIPKQSKLMDKLTKLLNSETKAYILLTDFVLLSNNERYNWYKEVLSEFNNLKKLVYYGRFIKSNDLLNNIDSLADSMHNLLPEEFYDATVKMHCKTILGYIKAPSIKEKTSFENAVILLGVHGKFWTESQYQKLQDISIPLIKFFRENEIAKKMKGLLSEDIIFSWYEDYGWTVSWREDKWKLFFKKISDIENNDFYSFKSEDDFRLKLKFFIHFHKNTYIRNLLVPLAVKILGEKDIAEDEASFVPSTLDDDFKTPTIHFDNDISYFTFAIENYEVPILDLLYILDSVECNYFHHNPVYQLEELYRKINSQLEDRITQISEEALPELYKLFTKYINTEEGIYISDFNKYIKLLNDNQKIKIYDLLLNDLIKNEKWQSLWMLNQSIILLLDIKDKEKSYILFNKLKSIKKVYGECVAGIYIGNLKEMPLYEIAASQYPKLFPEAVKKEEERQLRLSEIKTKICLMQKKEINVITEKEVFLGEVQKIFNYLDEIQDTSNRDTDRGRLLDLQTDYIYDKVQYDYKDYVIPPVFSSFAIKFLFNATDENQKLNRNQTIKYIEDWFSSDKYFWRYFFWLFICHYKKEETDKFLEDNTFLIDRIKNSMEQEVAYYIEENDISVYDGGRNRFWVVPFVHYLSRFYNNKLPGWFEKSKILNFIAYPAWQLSTDYGVHINGEFKWQNWNSVFDWIRIVSDIDEDMIIEKSLSILPELKSDQSITQIVTVFVEKIKTNEKYKQQMLDVIINKTIEELQKDYKDHNEKSIMNGGALSSFWRETQEDLIDKLYPYVDFSKYNPDDINYCRRSVFEYFLNFADERQKNKVIISLRKRIHEENIRIYLAKLGYKKAIIETIDGFLKGDSLKTDYTFYSPLFGKTKKSIFVLKKYLLLYEYSLGKHSDRRQHLTAYAKSGILQTVTQHNFWFIKYKLKKFINHLISKNLYSEGVQDFLNEIEQKIYGDE